MCFHGSAKIRESCFGSVLNEYLLYLLGQFYHSSFGFKVVGSKIYSMNIIQQLSGKTHLGTVFYQAYQTLSPSPITHFPSIYLPFTHFTSI